MVKNLAEPGSGGQDAYAKAFMFFQLPHGLLAVSITTTFVPDLARFVARKDKASFIARSSLGRAAGRPSSPSRPRSGCSCWPGPIVGAFLQHGQFASRPPITTSRALAGFSLGLVGFSVYLFVLRGFYAHQDTRTPFVINVVENALNIVLAVVLVGRYGVLGLGLAFALAYLLSAAWALQVLSYKVPGYGAAPDLRQPGPHAARRRAHGRAGLGRRPARRRHDGREAAATGRRRARVVGVVAYLGVLAPAAVARAGRGPAADRPDPAVDCRHDQADPALVELSHRQAEQDVQRDGRSRVQLEQAIREAQDQHRRLKEQAANVIASQKQAELRLNQRIDELEKVNGNARQALRDGRRCREEGRHRQGRPVTSAAETIATALIQLEKDIEDLKTLALQSTQASDQAKAAVAAERPGAAAEAGRAAEAPEPARAGQDAGADEQGHGHAHRGRRRGRAHPRARSGRRSRPATPRPRRMAELNEMSVDAACARSRQATANAEAQARLSELRAELGLEGPRAWTRGRPRSQAGLGLRRDR